MRHNKLHLSQIGTGKHLGKTHAMRLTLLRLNGDQAHQIGFNASP
jgi:hypothetical protein